MIKRITLMSLFTSGVSTALATTQSTTPIEVGKHANVGVDAFSMLLSLLMVLAIIIVSAFILKKFQRVSQTTSAMKIVASLPLGTKERLVVVDVNGEQLLLGVSHQQVTLLKTLDTPIETTRLLSAQAEHPLFKYFLKQNNKNETS